MVRRTLPFLMLAVAGCGGAGQSTTTALSPLDPSGRANGSANNATPEMAFHPAVGTNVSLGPLHLLSPKSPLAKPLGGKPDKDGAERLGKLGSEALRFDPEYRYVVVDATAPQVSVGAKGASAPLPADAKTNPDGSVWVVDAETRRLFTLTDVKRPAEGKPSAESVASADLVRPNAEAPVPPLALVAEPDAEKGAMDHALRILAKGVGSEGAPAKGARVRLKGNVPEKEMTPLARSVVRTLKRYGAVLDAGQGKPALSALADPRWSDKDVAALGKLRLTDFELFSPEPKPVGKPKAAK